MRTPAQQGLIDIPWLHVAAASLLLIALNAVKPVHGDDPVYLLYGAEFVKHPLNPYAFHFGSPWVIPANHMLAPPVLPYWLGAGTLFFGDQPVLLKLWLLPFALTLAWAVDFLAARLAPSLRVPLIWLCVISPITLPGFNFMLDVPALALGLTALAIAMRSMEQDSWVLALLAGLVAALAIQTKYTGITSCVAILVWHVLRGRPVRGVLVVSLALALVVGWECLGAWFQGESHFLVALEQRQGGFLRRYPHLAFPLLSHMAGLAPAVALLGLMALGWTDRGVAAVGLAMSAAFGILAIVPSQAALFTGPNGKPILTASNIVYCLLAVPVWIVFMRGCLQLMRQSRGPDGPDRLVGLFLLTWLAMEMVGYFAMSPFPAARRVASLLLVFTFIVGRMAHQRGISSRAAGRIAACGVALALLLFVTDSLDASAGRAAAREVTRRNYPLAQGCTFWHLSWFGFSYYADREGLRPLQLNRQMPRPGDLIALHDLPDLDATMAHHPEIRLKLIDTVRVGDCFPLKATGYYDGRTPLENQHDERIRVLVYLVTSVDPHSQ
ncbi:MAG: hypothetical protein ABSF90_12550 [Syntrophobacteraceae bacterium]|jgi:multisubunit Na+/H+ antiporter MnhF subunit